MMPRALRGIAAITLGIALLASSGCASSTAAPAAQDSREVIYLLRSIRELAAQAGECPATRTGFEPYATDAARDYSFWSIESRAADGRVASAHVSQVATLRGCFGPTPERTRQNFSADIQLGALSFQGRGECVAILTDFPEPGLFPVRCHLVLSGLPAPYSGGLLTTNTLTSQARFGGDTEPSGYTQASIATIRLWKARAPR